MSSSPVQIGLRQTTFHYKPELIQELIVQLYLILYFGLQIVEPRSIVFQGAKGSRKQSFTKNKGFQGARCSGEPRVPGSKVIQGAKGSEEQIMLWSKVCWGPQYFKKQSVLGCKIG